MLSVGSFFGRGFDSQGYIESFNGNLRDECLNVEVFFNLADARGSCISGGATIIINFRT